MRDRSDETLRALTGEFDFLVVYETAQINSVTAADWPTGQAKQALKRTSNPKRHSRPTIRSEHLQLKLDMVIVHLLHLLPVTGFRLKALSG